MHFYFLFLHVEVVFIQVEVVTDLGDDKLWFSVA